MIRPNCENCYIEYRNGKKCIGVNSNLGEFELNPKAKQLLMSTKLTGFCDRHFPKRQLEGQIDYSFAEQEVAVW